MRDAAFASRREGVLYSLIRQIPREMRKITQIRNPKLEFRNKVKIRTRKNLNLRRPDCTFSSFPPYRCFGFRISRFGFPGEVFGSGFAGLGEFPGRDRWNEHPRTIR
jgi:hypothetical protein